MLAGAGIPVIFPSCGSVTRRPLPSHGSLGMVPRFQRYYGALRLLLVLPVTSLGSASGTLPRDFVRSGAPPPRVLWLPADRDPGHRWTNAVSCLSRKRRGLPGSWTALLRTCPALRPRWDLRARPQGPSVSPSAKLTASAPTLTLSGLNHAAHALPVYASRLRSPANTQHSVPGGGQPSRAGFSPAELYKGFQVSTVPSLLARLTWRTSL